MALDHNETIKVYVVSVQDAESVQIDFDLPVSQLKKCIKNKVPHRSYMYVDKSGKLLSGHYFKCHLDGLSSIIAEYTSQEHDYKASKLLTKRINDLDGHVHCIIKDVDPSNRVFVVLYDPVTQECINTWLSDVLKEELFDADQAKE